MKQWFPAVAALCHVAKAMARVEQRDLVSSPFTLSFLKLKA